MTRMAAPCGLLILLTAELRVGIERLQRKADDYDFLARALGEHADLAAALYDRLGPKSS